MLIIALRLFAIRTHGAPGFGEHSITPSTQETLTCRAARDALPTIGEGSKNSPRARFEARYANIAGEFALKAMEDLDTAAIVTLGRQVLQERTAYAHYMRGTRALVRRSIRMPETVIRLGRILEGSIAHVTMYRDQAGALSVPTDFLPALVIAEYRAGNPVHGGLLPLQSREGRDDYGMTEHSELTVDPLTVRLFEDEGRAAMAEIGRHIMETPVFEEAPPPEYAMPEPMPPRVITLNPL